MILIPLHHLDIRVSAASKLGSADWEEISVEIPTIQEVAPPRQASTAVNVPCATTIPNYLLIHVASLATHIYGRNIYNL